MPKLFHYDKKVLEPRINQLLDPVNRLYRYRAAEALARFLLRTRVTPNQITIAHTLVGVGAAGMIYLKYYVLAVLMYELRTLLDCTDGVLARVKNQSSSMGRILDTLGDGISFNALMFAGALRMIQDFENYRPSLILIFVFCFAMTATHCGVTYQLIRRKLVSILTKTIDSVELDWREGRSLIKTGTAPALARFGFWLDSGMIRFISEEWFEKIDRRWHREDWKERALGDAVVRHELAHSTRKRALRNAIRFTSYLSDDNVFAIMSFSFLISGFFPEAVFPFVHPVLIAFSAGFVYAIISLLLALHFFHDFYHGVYRE
jgi:phosphatidylglycerophosphate synthase